MNINLFGENTLNDDDTKISYQKYIRSSAWKAKREQALYRAGYKCQRCGISRFSRRLDVHHLTYARLGREDLSDLMVVCSVCHESEDEKREILNRQENERKLYEARLNGWAEKKYGLRWYDSIRRDDIEVEFDDWLERQ